MIWITQFYTENLTKKFGEFIAVNNVSLKIKQAVYIWIVRSKWFWKKVQQYVVMYILKPTSGKIYLMANENITDELEIKDRPYVAEFLYISVYQ